MIRIATRNSELAIAQARRVAALLGGAELVKVSSDGEPGDKARFVRGVERALLGGDADVGVHSAKDLPAEMPEGLAIAAVPAREDPADAWIATPRGRRADLGSYGRQIVPSAVASLDDVPEEARVGTASLRRRAQLLAIRPDLRIEELHGNVDTRLRRLEQGELDAIVLAVAGLRRLGREGEIAFAIPPDLMTPAPGQGALALQSREGDETSAAAAAEIGDEGALRELTAERAAVAVLEATCATPIGVHARIERVGHRGEMEPCGPDPRGEAEGESGARGEVLVVGAFVGLPDGSEWIRDRVEGDAERPAAAGALLAERLLSAGARDLLDRAEEWSERV